VLPGAHCERSFNGSVHESYAQLGANAEVLEFFDRFLYNVGLIEELA